MNVDGSFVLHAIRWVFFLLIKLSVMFAGDLCATYGHWSFIIVPEFDMGRFVSAVSRSLTKTTDERSSLCVGGEGCMCVFVCCDICDGVCGHV